MSGPDDLSDTLGPGDTTDTGRRTYTVYHEWDAADPLHLTVVSSVAAATNTDPASLPPLYDSVDPDGLEQLLQPTTTHERRGLTISFRFADCAVHVTGTGEVTVRPSETATAED